MPLDCEVNIEKNAPVRLLNAVMERMDYSKLYAAYSRLGRIEYSPKILLKIMVYGLCASRYPAVRLKHAAEKTCTSSICLRGSVRRITTPSTDSERVF